MKTDLYTKAVLTVIAVCLLCLVFQGRPLVPAANAQEAPPASKPVTDVNIVSLNGRALNTYNASEALPVRVIGRVTTN